jgi:hypothetical protein
MKLTYAGVKGGKVQTEPRSGMSIDGVDLSAMRELIGDEGHETDDPFNAENEVIAVCAGKWHREGLDWHFYVDPEWD